MKDRHVHRGIQWLCWLALATVWYGASFFVVMAIVCRCCIQLSDTQLQVISMVYRPVYKVLTSSVVAKGLQVFAGLDEIEVFFFFNHLQDLPLQPR